MSYYHTDLSLNEGRCYTSENLGRELFEIGSQHPSWRRELMLEAIRVECYPEKRSRLFSCFGCYSSETIKFYQEKNCHGGYIYEVEMVELSALVHVGDFNAVEPKTLCNYDGNCDGILEV